MGSTGRLVDALGLYLSGGASNTDPDSSLGGVCSSSELRGMGAIFSTPIPGVRVDNIFPACGEGEAALVVDGNGDLVFTPPGGTAGTAVTIAAGETKILAGADENKAIKVYRESGLDFTEDDSPNLRFPLNGVLGMKNIASADRVAGITTYRALFLKANGPYGVTEIELWMPPVSGAQAVYSLALETPSGSTIQTIASETTAPTGLSWSTPTAEGSALWAGTIDVGKYLGLWIRRVFPAAGDATPQENFQLAMNYKGA